MMATLMKMMTKMTNKHTNIATFQQKYTNFWGLLLGEMPKSKRLFSADVFPSLWHPDSMENAVTKFLFCRKKTFYSINIWSTIVWLNFYFVNLWSKGQRLAVASRQHGACLLFLCFYSVEKPYIQQVKRFIYSTSQTISRGIQTAWSSGRWCSRCRRRTCSLSLMYNVWCIMYIV